MGIEENAGKENTKESNMEYTLKYKNKNVENYNELLDSFHDSDFNSIRTSTVPFLDYWKNYDSNINNVNNLLKINNSNLVSLDFEHKTPSVSSNRNSFTDLMIFFDKDIKIAIEAKYTEGKKGYEETIHQWFDNSENRQNVLEHWKKIIQPFSNSILDLNKADEIQYQMLHRTASACYANMKKAVVLYQLFCDNNNDNIKYKNELMKIKSWISPKDNLVFALHFINVVKNKSNVTKGFSNFLKHNNIYSFISEKFEIL